MPTFAIRRKSDGKLMPDAHRQCRSWTEFEHYGPPRLFPTRGGAATSLQMWCKGIWTTDRDEDGRSLPYVSERYQRHRNPHDYDVVEVTVSIKE